MSLNKFKADKNISDGTEKGRELNLNIGCSTFHVKDSCKIDTGDGNTYDLKTPTNGVVGSFLKSDGNGGTLWGAGGTPGTGSIYNGTIPADVNRHMKISSNDGSTFNESIVLESSGEIYKNTVAIDNKYITNLDINSNQTIINIEGDITQNQTDITNLDNRVTTNETDITNLDNRVTTNETDITNLEIRVTQNEIDIAANTSSIATVNGNVVQNAIAIGSNSTKIATNLTSINNINSEITDLETKTQNISLNTTLGDTIIDGKISNTINGSQYSTGIIEGGTISIPSIGSTTYDISSGNGIIVSIDGSFKKIEWNNLSGLTHTYTANVSYIYIDSSGLPQFQNTTPTPDDKRNQIILGAIIHPNQINIITIQNRHLTCINPSNQLQDFYRAIGPINQSGNIVGSSSLLTVNRTAGDIFALGANFNVNVQNPNNVLTQSFDSSISPDVFSIIYRDGSVKSLTATSIIPSEYDNDNGASSPGTVGNAQFSVMYVLVGVGSVTIVLPGQYLYPSIADARIGLLEDTFIIPSDLVGQSVTIAFLITKGNETDLNSVNSVIIQAGKFGAGSSSGGSIQDLQTTYENSSIPQIQTSQTLGALTVKNNGLLDSNDVIGVQNLAGSSTFSVKGNGDLNVEGDYFHTGQKGILVDVSYGTNNYVISADDIAGSSITTGSNNFIAGLLTGSNLETGNSNVFIGQAAGEQMILGNSNTFIGLNSGKNMISDTNTAIGNSSLRGDSIALNNTGANNTALGRRSLFNLTSGERNSTVGDQSGLSLTTGSFNTLLGTLSDGSTFDYTIGLGYKATPIDNNQMLIGSTVISEGIDEILPAITENTDLGSSNFKFKNLFISDNLQTGDVVINMSTPPTIGQVLKATSTTAASWQNESGGGTQNLSIGTTTVTTQDINITNGTGITLPSGTSSLAGLLSKQKFDEIELNNAKVSNVDTDLTLGTQTTTTIDIESSDGTGVTLPSGTSSLAGLLSKQKFDEIELNNAKTSGIPSLTNAGNGQSLVSNSNGALKSITAGTNVTLTSTGTNITINSSGGGTGGIKSAFTTSFYYPGLFTSTFETYLDHGSSRTNNPTGVMNQMLPSLVGYNSRINFIGLTLGGSYNAGTTNKLLTVKYYIYNKTKSPTIISAISPNNLPNSASWIVLQTQILTLVGDNQAKFYQSDTANYSNNPIVGSLDPSWEDTDEYIGVASVLQNITVQNAFSDIVLDVDFDTV